jgi:hypothetical protein
VSYSRVFIVFGYVFLLLSQISTVAQPGSSSNDEQLSKSIELVHRLVRDHAAVTNACGIVREIQPISVPDSLSSLSNSVHLQYQLLGDENSAHLSVWLTRHELLWDPDSALVTGPTDPNLRIAAEQFEKRRRAEQLNDIGLDYWQKGDLSTAITHLTNAIAVDPLYADAYSNSN